MFDLADFPDVRVANVQYSCRHILWMVEDKEGLDLYPDFQRRIVWSNKQCSELIESILLGIPIPVIYLFENQYGIRQVLDGLQRLSAIVDFMSGRCRLKGLTVLRELNGCSYDDLPRKLQGVIDDYTLMFYVIQPPTSEQVKYEILRRVNMGGTALNYQEMREMLYNGRATQLLNDLRMVPEFLEASHFVNSKRKADSCLVLRCITFNLLVRQRNEKEMDESFMVFYNGWGDVNELLAKSMVFINQRASAQMINRCYDDFVTAMRNGLTIGGQDAFFFQDRRYGRQMMNPRLFEMLTTFYADDIALNKPDKVRELTNELKTRKVFSALFRGSKADMHGAIFDRIGIVESMINKLHHD